MDITDFLIEFTNEGRYEVFKSLFHGSKRHSELEKELDIPGPEVSRSLKRLTKKQLVAKILDNKYEITSLGKLIHEILRIFETLLEKKDFFNEHEINLPLSLILQLGNLREVKVGDQTMQNIQAWSDLVKDSKEFIYAISEQFQDAILPIIEKKLNQDLKIKALVNEGILEESVKVGQIFKDRHAVYDKMNAFENVKVLNQNNLSLLACDKGAILFLNNGNKIDYSQCLISSDASFIEWSSELFRSYWKKGKNLSSFIKK